MILSYVYRDALGGDATQGSGYAGQNMFGWYADRNWSSSVDPIDSNTRFTMDFSSGRTTTNSIGIGISNTFGVSEMVPVAEVIPKSRELLLSPATIVEV